MSESTGSSAEKIMPVILEKRNDFTIENVSTEQLSEAYELEISPEKVLIRSGTDKGLFYGFDVGDPVSKSRR
ncbi:MAG: hypothetical protein U5N56_06565 [Candidatus Marinimicrobia bacterium]|nr:hypothetical protein [Candidatus Neomarinimicrobiota bacterium]